jgi:hypothetical protein
VKKSLVGSGDGAIVSASVVTDDDSQPASGRNADAA